MRWGPSLSSSLALADEGIMHALKPPPVEKTQDVLRTKHEDGQSVDWRALYRRTVDKFPRTLKRLGA